MDVLRYNAIEGNHLAYVNARKDHLELLETAVDKAETRYGTDTSGLSVPAAVPNSGCVARYDNAITALRDKIDDAETDFETVARTAGKKSVSGHLADFKGVSLAVNPAAARVVVPTVTRPADFTWNDDSSSTAYSCPAPRGGRLNGDILSKNRQQRLHNQVKRSRKYRKRLAADNTIRSARFHRTVNNGTHRHIKHLAARQIPSAAHRQSQPEKHICCCP